MANKAKPGRFTEAELELMDILWDSGACTVQGIVDRLPPSRPLAYTTVQTVLNVLHRKGGVRRKLRDRAYHYEAAISRFDAASTALGDLVHKLFGQDRLAQWMRHQNAKSQLRNDTPCLAAYDARHLCDEERSELFERLCTPGADWAEGDRLSLEQ